MKDQLAEHSLHVSDGAGQIVEFRPRQHSEIVCGQRFELELQQGPHRNLQEGNQGFIAISAAALSDVGADRDSRAPHLSNKSESLLRREVCGESVDDGVQLPNAIDDTQIVKALHVQ